MKGTEKILSIIIPCYNSARFVGETIEMLYMQGLDDCELILVNDGSVDHTLDVLRRYEDRDEVKVINQENAGVSVARNTGLMAASGRYVYFLDSDDTLTENTLSFFRMVLQQHSSCQMFTFGYEMREAGVLKKRYVYPAFDGQEWEAHILTQNFLTKKFCVNICACIYERAFLRRFNLYFKPGMHMGEDVLFIHHAMLQDGVKVYSSARVCFVYQLRSDSATQAYRSYGREQYMSMRIQRTFFEEYCSKHIEMRSFINFYMCYVYLSSLYYYFRSDVCDSQINIWFSEDGYLRFRSIPFVSLRLNLSMFLSRFIPIRWLLDICKREKS